MQLAVWGMAYTLGFSGWRNGWENVFNGWTRNATWTALETALRQLLESAVVLHANCSFNQVLFFIANLSIISISTQFLDETLSAKQQYAFTGAFVTFTIFSIYSAVKRSWFQMDFLLDPKKYNG